MWADPCRLFLPNVAWRTRSGYPSKKFWTEEPGGVRLRRGPEPGAMSVTVAAPARLHLGFLDPSGGLGRRFASMGLALAELGTRISIRTAAAAQVEGPERARVEQHLDTLRRHLGLSGPYAVKIEQTVPAHAGLGSGTQIALALAAA